MERVVTETIDSGEIAEDELRQLVRMWFGQADEAGDTPDRRRIDPFAVPSLASSLALFDVGPEGRLTYRVMGENIRKVIRTNPIGLSPREVLGEGPYSAFIENQLLDCVDRRLPIYSKHDFVVVEEKTVRRSVRIVMPYADDGRVSRLLGFQMFSEDLELRSDSELRIDDWRVERLAFVDRP